MNLLYYKIRPEILASSGYFGFVGPNSIHAINPTIPLLVDSYKVQIPQIPTSQIDFTDQKGNQSKTNNKKSSRSV